MLNKMGKNLVLCSGGVDSLTCLAMAIDQYSAANVLSVFFTYGQKHIREKISAREIAAFYGIQRLEYDISQFFVGSDSALLSSSNRPIEHGSYEEQTAGGMLVPTYVPFRNGVLLSLCASLALSIDSSSVWNIWVGIHLDDAKGAAYPDCSKDFFTHIREAVSIGTCGGVKLKAPFIALSKKDIVAEGLKLHVPYHLTWSCYDGGEKACGQCASCLERKAAFEANNITDPISYI